MFFESSGLFFLCVCVCVCVCVCASFKQAQISADEKEVVPALSREKHHSEWPCLFKNGN